MYIHTCIHTYIHTYIHTHTQTYTHTHTDTHTHTHTHTHTRSLCAFCVGVPPHTDTHTPTQPQTHTDTHAHIALSVKACLHTKTQTHSLKMHAAPHTHMASVPSSGACQFGPGST